ncbi:MAG TPA: hypothetical protein VLA93_07125 [Pyrinomonadaceae bacterium]|nr:hypothetical protein [Pyrinomonadaceae bacterium]
MNREYSIGLWSAATRYRERGYWERGRPRPQMSAKRAPSRLTTRCGRGRPRYQYRVALPNQFTRLSSAKVANPTI